MFSKRKICNRRLSRWSVFFVRGIMVRYFRQKIIKLLTEKKKPRKEHFNQPAVQPLVDEKKHYAFIYLIYGFWSFEHFEQIRYCNLTTMGPWSNGCKHGIPIVCQITDDSLRQVVYIVPYPGRWPLARLAIRYWGGLHQ